MATDILVCHACRKDNVNYEGAFKKKAHLTYEQQGHTWERYYCDDCAEVICKAVNDTQATLEGQAIGSQL